MADPRSFVSTLRYNFKYMSALQSKRRGITRAMLKLLPESASTSRSSSRWSGSTLAQGTRVHAHLYHTIECARRKECDCVPKPRKTNAMAAAIRKKLSDEHFLPLLAEVPVVVGWLGTRMDMVAARPAFGTQILIEVKTGNLSADWNGIAKFREPLKDIPYTHENQAWVQLMIESAMCRKAFGVSPDDLYIVVASRNTSTKKIDVRMMTAPRWTRDNKLGDAVLAKLLQPAQRKRTVPRKKKL